MELRSAANELQGLGQGVGVIASSIDRSAPLYWLIDVARDDAVTSMRRVAESLASLEAGAVRYAVALDAIEATTWPLAVVVTGLDRTSRFFEQKSPNVALRGVKVATDAIHVVGSTRMTQVLRHVGGSRNVTRRIGISKIPRLGALVATIEMPSQFRTLFEANTIGRHRLDAAVGIGTGALVIVAAVTGAPVLGAAATIAMVVGYVWLVVPDSTKDRVADQISHDAADGRLEELRQGGVAVANEVPKALARAQNYLASGFAWGGR